MWEALCLRETKTNLSVKELEGDGDVSFADGLRIVYFLGALRFFPLFHLPQFLPLILLVLLGLISHRLVAWLWLPLGFGVCQGRTVRTE